MEIITDDTEVFRILENAGAETFDVTRAGAHEFRFGNVFALLLFMPHGLLKGCRLYLIEKTVLAAETGTQLLPDLLSLPEEHGFRAVKTEGLAIAERFISGRSNATLFYDAH